MFPDVFDIQSGELGTLVTAPETSISALIGNGIAVAGKLALGQVYTIRSKEEAKELGLNSAYDTSNSVLLYYHIEEFFRMAGEGTVLHLMVVPQTVLPGDFLEDTGNLYAKKLLAHVDVNNKVQQLGVVFNPAVTYTETAVDGLNADIRAAISKAQGLYQWAFDSQRPLNILLEGRAFSGTAAAALNLRAIPSGAETLEAHKVSLIIGQDHAFADGLAWAFGKKHAAVGTALGTIASIQMNQNIGEIETLNLSDAVRERWLYAGLSSHVRIEDVEAQLQTLDTKGYIFPVKYSGVSGYRWNDDHTCVPVKIDEEGRMNEFRISLGRTMNNIIRSLYIKLIPEVKKVKQVDPQTGFMPLGVVKDLEKKGDDVFEDYQANGWISGGKMYVDPKSDIVTPPASVKTLFVAVPTGIVGKLQGFINLKKSL